MKTQKTIYHLIVDKSGSMSDCIASTITGFNEQVSGIRRLEEKYPNQDISIGLTTFNNHVDHHYFQTAPRSVNKLNTTTYRPDGSTALLDAIGVTVKRLERLIQAEEVATTAVVVIITDGYENASQKYKLADIRAMISRLEETGKWTFSFLGATLDAVDVAETMNIKRHNSMSFDKDVMEEAVWDKLSVSMDSYMSKKVKGLSTENFLDENEL